MRIRKLAKELELEDGLVLAALEALGCRYKDAEQQLSSEVELRVRLYVRQNRAQLLRMPLRGPVARPAPVAARPAPASTATSVPVVALPTAASVAPPVAAVPGGAARPSPKDDPLTQVYGGVVPLADKKLKEDTQALIQRAKGEADRARRESAQQIAQQDQEIARLRAALSEAQSALQEAQSARAAAEERLRKSDALELQLRRKVEELEADRDGIDAHRRALQRQVSESPLIKPLEVVLEQRGLVGKDEMALAIRGLLEAKREGQLLPLLQTTDPESLSELLLERVVLVADGEDAPEGAVAVRVGSHRSELDAPTRMKDALRRFSTACLLHNLKTIVIVGGSPVYHRVLKEGLDSRIQLRPIPGTRRGRIAAVPSADLILVWAPTILDHAVSERFPEGLMIPHRGVSRMLLFATEQIEAGWTTRKQGSAAPV